MTIAAGFICSDGILLASDTLYSGSGVYKFGQKFWVMDRGDITVVFGGAGTGAGLTRAHAEIDRKLKAGMSRIRVVDLIDMVLKKVSDKLPDLPEWKTHALVAIRIGNENLLYENDAGANMLSEVRQPFQCVGYARSLGWYFARSLFKGGMSLKWARVIAAHLIANVKEYSEYCGGGTQFVEIPNVGQPQTVTDQSVIADLESYLAPLTRAMNAALPDGTSNEETVRARLLLVTDAINKAVRAQVLSIGEAPMAFRSDPPLPLTATQDEDKTGG
jgi:hypothetical protein